MEINQMKTFLAATGLLFTGNLGATASTVKSNHTISEKQKIQLNAQNGEKFQYSDLGSGDTRKLRVSHIRNYPLPMIINGEVVIVGSHRIWQNDRYGHLYFKDYSKQSQFGFVKGELLDIGIPTTTHEVLEGKSRYKKIFVAKISAAHGKVISILANGKSAAAHSFQRIRDRGGSISEGMQSWLHKQRSVKRSRTTAKLYRRGTTGKFEQRINATSAPIQNLPLHSMPGNRLQLFWIILH